MFGFFRKLDEFFLQLHQCVRKSQLLSRQRFLIFYILCAILNIQQLQNTINVKEKKQELFVITISCQV